MTITWKERIIRATKVADVLNDLNLTPTDIVWLSEYLNGELEADDPVLRPLGLG